MITPRFIANGSWCDGGRFILEAYPLFCFNHNKFEVVLGHRHEDMDLELDKPVGFRGGILGWRYESAGNLYLGDNWCPELEWDHVGRRRSKEKSLARSWGILPFNSKVVGC